VASQKRRQRHALKKFQDLMSIQETLELRNVCCRTGVERKMSDLMDVKRRAAKVYRENWDGCRERWKQHYRLRKNPYSNPRWTFY
jgi:hypothetical protein